MSLDVYGAIGDTLLYSPPLLSQWVLLGPDESAKTDNSHKNKFEQRKYACFTIYYNTAYYQFINSHLLLTLLSQLNVLRWTALYSYNSP